MDRLPESIRKKMTLWRLGLCSMPKEYVEWHKKRAQDELGCLMLDYPISVLETKMVNDGWFDGMRVLCARIQTADGEEMTIRYSDSNQNFMRDTGHGWALLRRSSLGECKGLHEEFEDETITG